MQAVACERVRLQGVAYTNCVSKLDLQGQRAGIKPQMTACAPAKGRTLASPRQRVAVAYIAAAAFAQTTPTQAGRCVALYGTTSDPVVTARLLGFARPPQRLGEAAAPAAAAAAAAATAAAPEATEGPGAAG